ncbi:MAG TPA: hypothetical protein VLS28_01715 [Candidatus Sulfomarinibacteraceae bacterium]|nr:hypothetical protein [Candidatus Sulfomarinibacteraceae bacterium]
MHDDHPGAEELAQRLEAYASARLSPNRKASARIRSALVEEARMRALEAEMGGARYRHRARDRRVMTLLLAAAVTLGSTVGVLAASAPGSPFYGARVWLEAATLPADADARALERIRQIEQRLVDSERAVADADDDAVAAATEAYRAAVDAATTEAGTDADRIARLEATLGKHVAVLESLAERLPEAASSGIRRAIEASQKAVDKLDRANSVPGVNGNRDPSNGKPGNPGKP